MMIRLSESVRGASGRYVRDIRVNTNLIQYYHTDTVYGDDRNACVEITRIVFGGTPDIFVTQTPQRIDAELANLKGSK